MVLVGGGGVSDSGQGGSSCDEVTMRCSVSQLDRICGVKE